MSCPVSQRPSGFVLVGVVMLILALTILGLSLFSLSSYEAQFFGNSNDELQVFHAAGGALERAKLVLIAKRELQYASLGLPPLVDSTVAWQERGGITYKDGLIDWSGTDSVWIRVRASRGNASRVMMACFKPRPGIEWYGRLMTITDTLRVEDTGGTDPSYHRWPHTYLNGEIWLDQPQPSMAWASNTPGVHVIPPLRTSPIPIPDLASYWAQRAPAASPAVHDGNYRWNLGIADSLTYYKSAGSQSPAGMDPLDADEAHKYSVMVPGHALPPAPQGRTVSVRGIVVWMFEHGFRSQFDFTVQGSGDDRDCLVMVSRRNDGAHSNPEWKFVSHWFFGGLNVYGARLILVSDDEVRIEHGNNMFGSSAVSDLTIYARKAWILGPADDPNVPGTPALRLAHTYPHPSNDELLDWLNERGVLPGQSPATRNTLTLIPGTWSESHPIP